MDVKLTWLFWTVAGTHAPGMSLRKHLFVTLDLNHTHHFQKSRRMEVVAIEVETFVTNLAASCEPM